MENNSEGGCEGLGWVRIRVVVMWAARHLVRKGLAHVSIFFFSFLFINRSGTGSVTETSY
jgi:hypothetical protein